MELASSKWKSKRHVLPENEASFKCVLGGNYGFGINKLQQDIKRNLEKGKTDIGDAVFTFQKHLNELGRSMVKEYIEEIDKEVRNDTERLNKWEIVKSDVETSLLTSFGDVRYSRTYFQSKSSGEYAFLAEKMLGIKPRDKVSKVLRLEHFQSCAFNRTLPSLCVLNYFTQGTSGINSDSFSNF